MKRFALALAAALLTVGVLPGLASAAEVQVGSTTTALAPPTCPQESTVQATETGCAIVLDHTTAYETISDGTTNPDEITTPGVVDSFTLAISDLYIEGATLTSEINTLDTNWGSPPSVQLAVLRQIPSSNGLRYAVAAESPVISVLPYITGQATGTVTEFPLLQALPVVKGEILAITVPTWAPILTFGLSSTSFAYSQSHTQILTGTGTAQKSSCESSSTGSLAQSLIGDQANYSCNFAGTRLEYTALEITAPSVSASAKHHAKRAKAVKQARRKAHAKHASH